MKYGLDEKIIENVISIFRMFPELEDAILYGSRAKGNYQPGSDIDIALNGKNLDLFLINKISLKLDDLFLPYTFDLCIISQIDNSDLLDHIKRVGISLYKKPVA